METKEKIKTDDIFNKKEDHKETIFDLISKLKLDERQKIIFSRLMKEIYKV